MRPPPPQIPIRRAFFVAGLAVALFVPLFIFRALGPFDFWWWMSANIAIVLALSLAMDASYGRFLRDDVRTDAAVKVALGVVSAVVLYGIFFLGNRLAREILPFAGAGISQVYGFKIGASPARIILLMVLLIGPGEELFWRAFLQRNFQDRFGGTAGWLLATAVYAAVHAGSGNPILILAAAVCGFFWGYLFLRTRSLLLVAVSHTLWDLAVFIIFPFS
jgi:membrane protease YdiL (CAAX protease family)